MFESLNLIPVDISDSETTKLESEIKDYKSETMDELEQWMEAAAEVDSFIRGNHDMLGPESNGPHDDERGDERSILPNIPYLLSRIDRMVQYIRHEEQPPVVQTDEKVDFPTLSPEFEQLRMEMSQFFPNITDNELVAKILTARLDRFEEQSNFDDIKDELLEIAAQERVVCVLVGYNVEDEFTKEPAFVEPFRVGDFGYDPKAKRVRQGRWCWCVQRGMKRTIVESTYKTKLSEKPNNSLDNDNKRDTRTEESVPEKSKTVDVYHWFINNDETFEYVEENEQEEMLGEMDLSEEGEQPEPPEVEEVKKYRGGWQYVVVVNDKVIFNGQCPSPSGKPPLIDFAYRRMPRKVMGVSLFDLAKDFNMAMDASLQYALEAAYKMQPKTLYKKAHVKNNNDLLENTPSGFVEIDTEAPLTDAFMYLPGAPANASLYEAFERVKALADEMSGLEGIQIDDASKTKLSGDALEGIAQDRDGSAGRIKSRWYGFLKEVYTEVLHHILAFEDMETTLKLIGQAGITETISVNVGVLRLEDEDFQPTFDVQIHSPRNMPKNPVRRGQFLLEVIRNVIELLQIDPEAAKLWVKIADIPEKDEMIKMIDARIAQTQAAAAGQQGQNPELAKAQADMEKAKMETELAVRRRIAESTADAAERIIGDLAKVDPMVALSKLQELGPAVWSAFNAQAPQAVPPAAAQIPPEQMQQPNVTDETVAQLPPNVVQ